MRDAFERFGLEGRAALVTGGSVGLGYHMARGLLASGATVTIAGRRLSALEEAAERLRSEAPRGEVYICAADLSDRESTAALARRATEVMGGVDILVGNAGQDLFQPVDAITDEIHDQVMRVNFGANVDLTRALLPGMRARKWGRLLYSSSATSVRGSAQEGMSLYTASKGALNAFARTVAAEAGHDGITVNSLVLGIYWTDMVAEQFAEVERTAGKGAVDAFIESFASMTCVGRLGRPDEVEGLVQFLASDAGSYVTGTNLRIDGGMSAILKPNPTRG
jgi:NAD(P)-dependent dehydrogenase (short-subunit alcohol dehydrogenase family)